MTIAIGLTLLLIGVVLVFQGITPSHIGPTMAFAGALVLWLRFTGAIS